MPIKLGGMLTGAELREMLKHAEGRGKVSIRFSYEIFEQFVELIEKCELSQKEEHDGR
ncbi:hypothetical protein LCGC14_1129020 [marine sediment metagenome]|uniref:Uncharacterized protein n=1 Tax=marine sediment metagenome TaxID=412755 RepID=A0A0F9PJX7_9ZZZZ